MTYLDAERIQSLVEQSKKPPEYVLPGGVGGDVLERARARGVPLPGALVEWLELSNGPLVGPGGFYGLEPRRTWLDLETSLDWYVLWRERSWVPVASDGCGNEYVLMPQGDDGPVGFFETIRTLEAPEYVASSDLNHFLIGILEKELGVADWWPFVAEQTLEFDPGLALIDSSLLPWMA